MRSILITVWAAALLTGASANAQTARKTPPKKSDAEIRAAIDAHKADFDYLLGQWKFSAVSKEYGKFDGVWAAIKLPGGQLLDEYAVVDDKGEKVYVTTTLRAYNAVLDQWELVGMDTGNGLNDTGTGHRTGGEVQIEQTFGVMGQQPSTLRIRYFNIKADSFSWSADRSNDGGKTWISGFQTIEARRIGPARTVQLFPAVPKSR
ncbi:MAG TPA: hypothetical protein VGY57_00175 [Vicinamibacterales bacterium]|jgi:hypothetical protein|nr:hypothetical protein [Vicinamibacterales bacterium]